MAFNLHRKIEMTRPRLLIFEPKLVRDTLTQCFDLSQQLHDAEKNLIQNLHEVDQNRFFVRLGYRSLRTFCIEGLGITKVQAQRILLKIRRIQTTADNGTSENFSVGSHPELRSVDCARTQNEIIEEEYQAANNDKTGIDHE